MKILSIHLPNPWIYSTSQYSLNSEKWKKNTYDKNLVGAEDIFYFAEIVSVSENWIFFETYFPLFFNLVYYRQCLHPVLSQMFQARCLGANDEIVNFISHPLFIALFRKQL